MIRLYSIYNSYNKVENYTSLSFLLDINNFISI